MSLETATFVNDIDPANPLAGDKKAQGDDHFRLLKTVLKNTLGRATKVFRFPETIGLGANTVLDASYENMTILVSTSGGTVNLTLPSAGMVNGGYIDIMKIGVDPNPVFVIPGVGNLNGFAKLRLNVPFAKHRFLSTGGGAFYREGHPGEERAGAVSWYGGGVPFGFAAANGGSLLNVDYPELFAAWGTIWGAPDGSHFNIPNLSARFVAGTGGGYNIADTGGANSIFLTSDELPLSHGLGLSLSDSRTYRTSEAIPSTTGPVLFADIGGTQYGAPKKQPIELASGALGGSITGNLGLGQDHENRPPFTAMTPLFRLC